MKGMEEVCGERLYKSGFGCEETVLCYYRLINCLNKIVTTWPRSVLGFLSVVKLL